jgi:short-subunit dehydrogenase
MSRPVTGAALITGASSGIGAQFARTLAARGHDLVLVARSQDTLQRLAGELLARHAVRVEVIVADLAREHAARTIREQTDALGMQIDLLVNSAGFATAGRFEQLDPRTDHDQVMVNVVAPVDLAHQYLPAMSDRGYGAVINVASIGGFQPAPYLAVYSATKAFVLTLSGALWGEYHSRGIRVLALCPGPVDTAFFDVLGGDEAALGQRVPVDKVVDRALWALQAGRSHTVPGWRNRLLTHAPRLLPRRLLISITERATRPVTRRSPPIPTDDTRPSPAPHEEHHTPPGPSR